MPGRHMMDSRSMTVVILCLATWVSAPAHANCRQALAIGMDVSGSVDAEEYRFQLTGLANALTSDAVSSLLLRTYDTPVMISVFEWSGDRHHEVVLEWLRIEDEQTLANVALILSGRTRAKGPFTTAIGAAIQFGGALLDQVPECWRHTLDLSGDGKNNYGVPPEAVGSTAAHVVMTVNGLVIGGHDERLRRSPETRLEELRIYYRNNVVSGPGAFVEVARGYQDFEEAMTRKLIKELSGIAISSYVTPGSPAPGG